MVPSYTDYSKVNEDWYKLKKLHKFTRYEGVDKLTKLKNSLDKPGWHYLINQQFECSGVELENGTLLTSAVIKGCEATVSLLIKYGAMIDLPDLLGLRTPLHDSVRQLRHGSEKITEILLQNGANPNVIDVINCSPIHYASMKGDCETIKMLLCFGANINAKMNDPFVDSDSPAYNGRKKTALEITMCPYSMEPRYRHKGIDCIKTIMYHGHHNQDEPFPTPIHPNKNKEFATFLKNPVKMNHHSGVGFNLVPNHPQ